MEWIYIIFWAVVWATIGTLIGRSKDNAAFGLVLGLVLGPIGIIITLLDKGNLEQCPYCKSNINSEATVCKYCQREQPDPAAHLVEK